MSFISLGFIGFLAVLFCFYFLLPAKWQWVILLSANIVFYLSAGYPYLFYMLFTAVSVFICALLVEGKKEKYKIIREKECKTKEEKQLNKAECTKKQKQVMAFCLLANFGIWIVLKYSGFLGRNLLGLLQKLSPDIGFTIPEFILPLGISFYTFIAVGYCIDVYRGKYPAEKHFGRFLLFISFFPHIIQGPFSRYNKLKETLFEYHKFSAQRFSQGLLRVIWGVFKKTVIAYRLGIMVDMIYEQKIPYGGIYVLMLMIFVTLQLYADFSGYMDIVCGICRIMGIGLEENFKQPFFAKSIEEFWRRWHITLGAWFRDYVFYTISMSKRMQAFGRKCRERIGNTFQLLCLIFCMDSHRIMAWRSMVLFDMGLDESLCNCT